MADQCRPQQPQTDAALWQPIIEAWGRQDDDEDVVVVTDIAPSGVWDKAFRERS